MLVFLALLLAVVSGQGTVGSTALPCVTAPLWFANAASLNISTGTCGDLWKTAQISIASGTSCNISCAAGFIMGGSGVVTCRNGTWTDLSAAITCASNTTNTNTNSTVKLVGLGDACSNLDGLTVDAYPNPILRCVSTTAAPCSCINGKCAIPNTVVIVGAGQGCTGGVPNSLLQTINCQPGLICNQTTMMCAVPVNTTTIVYAQLGQVCGDNTPCDPSLYCYHDVSPFVCKVPPPAPSAPVAVGVNGKCGGTSNQICSCNTSPACVCSQSSASVVGVCVVPNATLNCAPGTGPAPSSNTGVVACVPCKWGTFSIGGTTACAPCPTGQCTPVPSGGVPTNLTVGPTNCEACPSTNNNDPNCFSTPICANCDLTANNCVYGDGTANSIIRVAICRPKCALTQASCSTSQTLINCQCYNVVLAQPTTVALNTAGLGTIPTTSTSTAIPSNGSLDGTVVTVTGSNAAPTIDATSGVIVATKDSTVNADTVVIGSAGAVVAQGASVTAGQVVVPASSTGVISVQNDPTTNTASTVQVQNANIPAGSTLALSGPDATSTSSVTIASTTGSTGTVTCDGTRMDGTVGVQVCVAPPSTSTGTATKMCTFGNLTFSNNVCGQPGTTVTVAQGATVTASGSVTIDPDVVVSGNFTVDAPSVNGATSVKATGSITINPDVVAPYIKNLTNCDAGASIYIRIGKTCDAIKSSGAQGSAFTSASVSTANFNCAITIVGSNGCQIPLKVVIASTGTTRRLLSTTSNCGTATVGNSGATYNVCQSTSAASHSSVSYIALCVALFIALFFQF